MLLSSNRLTRVGGVGGGAKAATPSLFCSVLLLCCCMFFSSTSTTRNQHPPLTHPSEPAPLVYLRQPRGYQRPVHFCSRIDHLLLPPALPLVTSSESGPPVWTTCYIRSKVHEHGGSLRSISMSRHERKDRYLFDSDAKSKTHDSDLARSISQPCTSALPWLRMRAFILVLIALSLQGAIVTMSSTMEPRH